MKKTIVVCGAVALAAAVFAGEGDVLARFHSENEGKSLRRIPSWVVPENAFVSISNPDFEEPDGATQARIFDAYRDKSDWNVITYTLRCRPDLCSPEVQSRVAVAAKRAKEMGIELLMDIDPRIMRSEFLARWPDECMRMRQFATATPDADGTARFRAEQDFMQDHMCWGSDNPYSGWQEGRLVSVYAVKNGVPGGRALPEMRTLVAEDVVCTTNSVSGTVRGLAAGETLLAEVEFKIKAADPYAPHLLPFTREMMLRYRKLGVHGAMRDEWGFVGPRAAVQERRAFWYSEPFAAAYARISGGRDYLKDIVAFTLGVDTPEMYGAVNAYFRTIYEGCKITEEDFYASDKEYFGPDAYVAKHPTWHTALWRVSEHMHNGIDWWVAKRDWAQSDEGCPVPVDTGMMRKFGTPLWMNEGYGPNPAHYARSLWQYMLCGGRMVYHGIYGGAGKHLAKYANSPGERKYHAQADLLNDEGIRTEEISRLLPLMTRAQIDSPVAHVFGHERLVNWLDPAYLDWGEPIAHGLGGRGYYADAFPASEIALGTFTVDKGGYVCVGGHRYAACVLYHLSASELEAWRKVVGKRRLATRVFTDPTMEAVADYLDTKHAVRQTPLLKTGLGGRYANRLPAPDGTMVLTDGTVVRVKGASPDLAGDAIGGRLSVGGAEVEYAARGMFAARVEKGALTGLAGGEVTRVVAPGLTLELDAPADIALTKIGGEWRGVWQTPDLSAPVPAALLKITTRWVKLRGIVPPAKVTSAYSVESGDSPPERFAAKELKRWIAELAKTPPALRFHLGVKHLADFPDDREFLGSTDGFAVRRKGDDVYIVSPKERGVLYGVYAFLERNSDIVWARGDEPMEAVFSRTDEFAVKDADFRERPVFTLRGWWNCGPQYHAGTEFWNARMRCNFQPASMRKPGVAERSRMCGFRVNPGGGHNLHRFMPESHFKEHPEYFCLVNGKRVSNVLKAQVCFSDFEGAKVFAAEAVKRVRELGYMPEDYAIKTEDNNAVCECPKCLADITLPDGKVVRRTDPNFRSTQFFRYLNAVMAEFRKELPTVRMDTFGYQFTAPVPAVRVDDSVNVCFCPYVKNDKYSILDRPNAKWKDLTDRWCTTATTNLVWREYWGDAMDFPRPLADVMVRDLRYIHGKYGVNRIYTETKPDCLTAGNAKKPPRDLRETWDVSAMEFWVLTRLMWDPYQDVAALRAEYLKRAYRRAAEPVGRFYALIREAWYADQAGSVFSDIQYKNAARYVFGKGIADKCRAALKDAARLAENEVPQVAMLVKRLQARFDAWDAKKGDYDTPEVHVPYRANAADAIAKGDDSVWAAAGLVERIPLIGKPHEFPADGTRVLFLHDKKSLFVRFECADSKMSEAFAKPYDPSVEFFPSGDHIEFFLAGGFGESGYYQLVADINGNTWDQTSETKSADFNAKWTSDVKKGEKGYTLTLTLPFESFGYEPTKSNRTAASFFRMQSHGDKMRVISSWGATPPHQRGGFGDLVLEM
jgi:hypothetical protein